MSDKPTPRIVICAGCGARERLAWDKPGVAVQLPTGWHRVGMMADSSMIFYCGECYRAEIAAAMRKRFE
jgi:hypothetical protein